MLHLQQFPNSSRGNHNVKTIYTGKTAMWNQITSWLPASLNSVNTFGFRSISSGEILWLSGARVHSSSFKWSPVPTYTSILFNLSEMANSHCLHTLSIKTIFFTNSFLSMLSQISSRNKCPDIWLFLKNLPTEKGPNKYF